MNIRYSLIAFKTMIRQTIVTVAECNVLKAFVRFLTNRHTSANTYKNNTTVNICVTSYILDSAQGSIKKD